MSAKCRRYRFAHCVVLLTVWVTFSLKADCASGHIARWLVADWQLDSPLGASEGILIALVEPSGWWRLDIGINAGISGISAVDVINRQGEGWTLAGAEAGGFSQPWHAPWRPVGQQTTAALETLTLHWASGPPDAVDETARTPAGGGISAAGKTPYMRSLTCAS